MVKIYLVFCLLLFSGSAFCQSADDTIPSPLKTMSYKQYNAYLDGDDIEHLNLAAELNNYPSAEATLVFKKQLALTPDQVNKITAINTELIRKKKEMGRMIIKNERVIDSLFRIKQLDDGSLIFYTGRYGLYQGELRNAILQTYLKVVAILTPDQLKKYQQIPKP